ncbi:MAG: hypothetical protein ACRD1K_14280, partial [Acidimicrobiales bacterium]
MASGTIKQIDHEGGVVSQKTTKYWFSRHVLAPGYEPALGDKVLFETAADRKTVTHVELWTAERSAALT